MSEVNISGTFVNDTDTGTIAYAEQIKNRTVDYSEYAHITDEIKEQYNLNSGFQNNLNKLFLHHYDEYTQFTSDSDIEAGEVIDIVY